MSAAVSIGRVAASVRALKPRAVLIGAVTSLAMAILVATVVAPIIFLAAPDNTPPAMPLALATIALFALRGLVSGWFTTRSHLAAGGAPRWPVVLLAGGLAGALGWVGWLVLTGLFGGASALTGWAPWLDVVRWTVEVMAGSCAGALGQVHRTSDGIDRLH